MEAGVHLPQVEFAGEGLSLRRLADTVDAARANGFAAVSVNDHFLFGAPWLDGLTALAAVAERSGPMTLATTVSLAALRGPVPLAKAVATLDVLSGGRVVAGVGAGSSRSDYDALGADFESRWQRFDEAVTMLRALLGGAEPPAGGRHFAVRRGGCCRCRGPPGRFRCGSGAGGRPPGCAAWRGWATGGWRRRTTSPRLASPRPARCCGRSWRRRAGRLAASRTRWSRCGRG